MVQTSACATAPPVTAAKLIVPINKTFSNTGAAAAAAKCPAALSIPENNAANEMKKI